MSRVGATDPRRTKACLIALHYFQIAFEPGREYTETQVNSFIMGGGIMDLALNPGWAPETAGRELPPPDFTGAAVDQFLQRMRERRSGITETGTQEQIVTASFLVLEDGTIKARLCRGNHLRISNSTWDHRPDDLYKRAGCPALLMPARQTYD